MYYNSNNQNNGNIMEICTVSQARANLFQLVDNVSAWHEPVYIVGKRNKAVLMSEEDYSGLMETMYLYSIPGMVESILQSAQEPIENFSDTLEWGDKE